MSETPAIESLPPSSSNQTTPPKRRWRRICALLALVCWAYLAAVVTIFVLMRFAGERWWPATLLLFSPRWLWAVPLGALVPIVILFCRRLWLPTILAGAVALFGIMDFQIPWRKVSPGNSGQTVIGIFTVNVHNVQCNRDLLNRLIDQKHPDIILLQDCAREQLPNVARERGWFVRQFAATFVISRYPIGREENFLPDDARAMAYASQGVPLGEAVCYVVNAPGGPVHLINVHLASPHASLGHIRNRIVNGTALLTSNAERRAQESTEVRRRVDQIGGSFILAGDFNTPDDSPIFHKAWAGLEDAFGAAGFGFGTTYAKNHTWLRIDHIVSTSDWHCHECWEGPDIGSGHRPVFVQLVR